MEDKGGKETGLPLLVEMERAGTLKPTVLGLLPAMDRPAEPLAVGDILCKGLGPPLPFPRKRAEREMKTVHFHGSPGRNQACLPLPRSLRVTGPP